MKNTGNFTKRMIKRILTGIAAGAFLFVCACSNSADVEMFNPNVTVNVDKDSDTASAVKDAGELFINMPAEVSTFHPLAADNEDMVNILSLVLEPALSLDAQGQIQPGIIETWDIDNTGKVYTFHVRKGVKFQDGSDVTADDIVFTMDTLMSLAGKEGMNKTGETPQNSESASPGVSGSASPETSDSVPPEGSTSPEVSDSPEVSTSPEVSDSPEVSTSPEVSDSPEVSTSPETSTSPDTTSPETSGGDTDNETGYLYLDDVGVISSYAMTDNYTIQVTATRKTNKVLYFMNFPVLSRNYYTGVDYETNKLPMGSGPYTVKSYSKKDGMKFVRNKNWWKTQPVFSSITARPVKDEQSKFSSYNQALIDMATTSSLTVDSL